MYLREFITTGHKIFGAASVPAVDSSYLMPAAPSIVSVSLDFGSNTHENVYTYIIGNNGVGKSSYFRTIISHFYANDGVNDAGTAAAVEYLLDMNVSVDKNFEITKKGIKAVYGDIRIVNFSREEGLISRFPRKDYFEFNPQTKRLSLTMLPLIYNKHDKLSLLADAMGYEEFQWSQEMQFRLTVDLEKDKTYVSRVNGFCITDLFEWINADGSEPIDVTNALSSTIKRWVENNHLHAIEETIKDRIRGTVVYGLLSAIVKKRIAKDGSISNVMSHNVIDMYAGLSIQLPEINKLTPDDIWVIALLVDMGFVKYNVLCNGVRLEDMSSGEKSMLHLYSSFASIPEIERGNLLVFYDEPENSLHPQWQQQFPLVFSTIVNNVYGIKKSHFLFATHSPLIIQNSQKTSDKNVFVLKFQREGGKFESNVITDIDAYCIESLMMDQFGLTYRRRRKQEETNNYVLQSQEDPIDSVVASRELKESISKLFAEVCKDE